jgi:hypothetical protein
VFTVDLPLHHGERTATAQDVATDDPAEDDPAAAAAGYPTADAVERAATYDAKHPAAALSAPAATDDGRDAMRPPAGKESEA